MVWFEGVNLTGGGESVLGLITLTFVALICRTNFGKVFLYSCPYCYQIFFDFSNCRDHTRNTIFRVLVGRIYDLE